MTHRPPDRSDPDGRVRAALVIAGLRVALEAWLAGSDQDQDLVCSIDRTFRRVEGVARTWMQTGG